LIVDSSVVVAMARGEPEASAFIDILDAAQHASISTATLLETSLVLRDEAGQRFIDRIIDRLTVVPFDVHHLAVARAAHRRFGRGSGHPASLNFGDCFSYALSVTTGEPLLFKGTDFALTDITPAYLPD
jgi:ribonuclease VapC